MLAATTTAPVSTEKALIYFMAFSWEKGMKNP